MDRITLANESARLEIAPERGGRVMSLCVGGEELLVGSGPTPLHYGAYIMAPWAGRLRRATFAFAGRTYHLPATEPPHAIHGLLTEAGWRVKDDGVSLSCALPSEWPFGGHVNGRYRLEPDGLRVTVEVHADRQPMPAVCGWHPWFRRELGRGGPLLLEFEPSAMYERAGDGIATGRLVPPGPPPWDDCFTGLVRPPRLVWPGVLALSIESSHYHWVVYDKPEHALCIEPQTGPPDGLNLNPVTVTPGRPLVLEVRLRWELTDGRAGG